MAGFETIGIDELDRLMEQDDTVLVEVLAEDAFHQAHIPGAINIPNDAPDFEQRFRQAVPDQDTPVVVYCASTECEASPTAARRLAGLGFDNVHDFEAGKKGWLRAGRKLDRAEVPPDAR